jgi:hypothetical protein
LKYLSVFTLLLPAVLLLSPASCANEIHKSRLPEIESALENIRLEHVPDRRVAVFNVEKSEEKPTVLVVETNVIGAALAVEELLNFTPAWRENIKIAVLPDPALNGHTRALVRVSVANMRRTPRHQAELIDQAIMGTELNILKRQGGWYYIQTPWDYLGWVTSGSISVFKESEIEENWLSSALKFVDAVDTRVYSSPSSDASVVTDVTLGAVLKYTGVRTRGFSGVELPDGRPGYIRTTELIDIPIINNTTSPNPADIVQTANRFHGLPYLWGGNSGKGLDCSGFTNTVFRRHGFMLPRDANMQINIGVEVQYDETFAGIEEGDLLFFGTNNRITHVGISLGGARFIHASSYVMENSLSEFDADFSEYRRRTLAGVRRI